MTKKITPSSMRAKKASAVIQSIIFTQGPVVTHFAEQFAFPCDIKNAISLQSHFILYIPIEKKPE